MRIMKLRSDISIIEEDNVKWLIIESDEYTKGYFIYYHITEEFAYDTWHPTLEKAYSAAFDRYGISKDQWVNVEE
jgi:hypothetical protein